MTGFSFWGQFIVAAIVVTGIVNIALTSCPAPIPSTTLYRALLVKKIILVGTMDLACGFQSLCPRSRYVLAPRLKASAKALAVLRATSAAEISLGNVVIALVSVFALLDPV
jgi:putative copper resistance protein D